MLCIVPCAWFDHYTTGLPNSSQPSVGILTFRCTQANHFRLDVYGIEKVRIEGRVASISIAVETSEFIIAAIDVNGC